MPVEGVGLIPQGRGTCRSGSSSVTRTRQGAPRHTRACRQSKSARTVLPQLAPAATRTSPLRALVKPELSRLGRFSRNRRRGSAARAGRAAPPEGDAAALTHAQNEVGFQRDRERLRFPPSRALYLSRRSTTKPSTPSADPGRASRANLSRGNSGYRRNYASPLANTLRSSRRRL